MTEPQVNDRVATFQDVFEIEDRITDLELTLKDGRVIPWHDAEVEATADPLLIDRLAELERDLAELREWRASVETVFQTIAAGAGLFVPTTARHVA